MHGVVALATALSSYVAVGPRELEGQLKLSSSKATLARMINRIVVNFVRPPEAHPAHSARATVSTNTSK